MNKGNKRKVCFPYFGEYTYFFKESLENLGAEVVLPPKITDRTVKIGTKHSSEMMCFPYKITLGNFLEAIEKDPDIDYLVMYDSKGTCRFRHYHILQKQTIENLGFDVKLIPLNFPNIFRLHKKVTPGVSKLRIIKEYCSLYKRARRNAACNEVLPGRPNVVIVGEIYTCIESSVNFDIVNRLKDFNCNVIQTVDLNSFFSDSLKNLFFRNVLRGKYYRKAMKHLNGPLGGHGAENIENILRYIDRGVEGILWLRPLSCMPESTVDMVVKKICQDNDVPILVFDIDESNFALNIETRLETFVEQMRIKNDD